MESQFAYFLFTSWPLVSTLFQAFVQENETVALPVECFHAVPAADAEEEQRIGEWIQLELLLGQGRQTVDPFPEVRIAVGNVDFIYTGKVIQHNAEICTV